MDDRRLDLLARALARRGSRRRSLTQAAKGGAFAVFGASAGLGASASAAARQGSGLATCTYDFTLSTATGPGAGTVQAAALVLEFGDDGAIDAGTLSIPDIADFPLVGQSAGRSLGLRIAVQDGLFATLTGIAQEPVSSCSGEIAGSFSGPETGTFGTWTAVATGGASAPEEDEAVEADDEDEDESDAGDDIQLEPGDDEDIDADGEQFVCDEEAEACDGDCYFLCEPGTVRNFADCSCTPDPNGN